MNLADGVRGELHCDTIGLSGGNFEKILCIFGSP